MSWKGALQQYILSPEKFEKETVVFYDETTVIVNDSFPKSKFHLLILPRNGKLSMQHPTTSLTERVKDKYEVYISRATDHIYNEFVKSYKLIKPLSGDDMISLTTLKDKPKFIKEFVQIGVHSVPSMANLHIHVITKDFYSHRLKNKKHYNSFTTQFFINWDELPLNSIPDKTFSEKQLIKQSDLKCSYCGKNFSNKFAQLRDHLQYEFNTHFQPI